ncbi:MAG: hypothetical protein KDB80_12570 [Planctomycetes bacterium]|nr:hypothetical protein [Planctomycetota bacterium]
MLKLAPLPALFLVAACGGGGSTPAESIDPAVQPVRVDLTTAVPNQVGGPAPAGITVDPDTGEIYYLDARGGILRFDPIDQSFELVADARELYVVSPQSDFTDIAAMGNGDFAITAMNDGFLFDLDDRSIRQHFCYVPGWVIEDPRPLIQLTNSVAWDAVDRKLIAQPITMNTATNTNEQSELGTFPETGGEGQDWHPIPDAEFLAGATTVDGGTIWLGCEDSLYRYDLTVDSLAFDQSLARFEVTEIAGMAFRENELLVLDATTRQLVRIPRQLLTDASLLADDTVLAARTGSTVRTSDSRRREIARRQAARRQAAQQGR